MISIQLTAEQIKVLRKDLVKAGVSLSEGPITDRVKSFEDALELYTGDVEGKRFLLDYKGNDKEILASVAFLKLSIIIEVLNEDWTPDWDNSNEYKYYPYFDMSNNTLVFTHYNAWNAYSNVSSRLCLRSKELAEYCGKQFIDLYKQSFLML
jgi:hypothetical protein